ADAVTELAARVPVPAPTAAATLATWVGDLGSEDFLTREAAAKALDKVAGEAAPLLRAAAEKSPSAEVRKAAAELLGRAEAPPTRPDDLKVLRAAEVLEQLGTPAARALLEKWAAGPAGRRATAEAKAALERLKEAGAR
ncbi:MAG: HEAT repeat domain-containing protein, partial [Gemmata sp.]